MKIITTLLVFISFYVVFIKEDVSISNTPQMEIETKSNSTIKITGLNQFKSSDLKVARKIIKDVFNINCEITEPIKINYNRKQFVCEKAQSELGFTPDFEFDQGKDITIFVTSCDLYSKGLNVRGLCFGNQIYIQDDKIKVTTIHELCHSFGLEHCQNQCIMNSYALNRWNTKTDLPIFCSFCKSKLP